MNKIQRVLLEQQFKNTEIKGWLQTTFWYMIDSKLRTKVRISKYLEAQVKSASVETYKIARSLRGRRTYDGIINILKWVKANFKYKRDNDNFGMVEKWEDLEVTMKNGYGDCESLNTIIYVLARLQGIGSDLLYACIGNVAIGKGTGGHFWLVYYSPRHDKLVSIDSTYYPSMFQVENRPRFKLTPKRYQSVWYFFNEKITLRGLR